MTTKKAPRKSSIPGGSRGGTLVGMFIGLVLGVLIAAGVVWYLNKMPLPFQNKELAAKDKPRPERNGEPARGEQAAAGPAPLPGKPGDKANEKPRFEFYKILPGADEAAPQGAKPEPKDGREAKAAPPADLLFLQAGAFQNAGDADNMKARLALMGMEASVQQVTVPEKGVMHRVRIGPYRSPDEMAKARTQLAQNGIEAGVVKLRDGKDAKDAKDGAR